MLNMFKGQQVETQPLSVCQSVSLCLFVCLCVCVCLYCVLSFLVPLSVAYTPVWKITVGHRTMSHQMCRSSDQILQQCCDVFGQNIDLYVEMIV